MRKISTFFSGLFLIVLLFGIQKTNAQVLSNHEIIVDSIVTADGRIAICVEVPGKPPENYKAPIAEPTKASTILLNVPAFDWSFGCSATSAAMIAGHYDNMGYPNMYTGPTNGGLMPMDNSSWPDVWIGGEWRAQCPLSATRDGIDGRTSFGHVDDYWITYGSTDPDPYIGNWTQHTYGECTGDYMKTNQSSFGNEDGSTRFWYWSNNTPMTVSDMESNGYDTDDGGYGFRAFCQSRGYAVIDMYNQRRYGHNGILTGFTYADFMAEIDAGRPVLIHITNHTMVGYGYDDGGGTNTVYIHDTWDYSDHTMNWGGTYSGAQHNGVTVLQLAPTSINVWTGNANTFWANGGNWSLGHIPTATEIVEIPNVKMPCVVDYYDAVCSDLTVYAGATIELRDQVLTVNDDLTVHGTIEMSQANAYLNVMDDIIWEANSSLDVLDNSTFIQIWGDWNFELGANVNPTLGFVDFEGTASSYIRCYDDNCSFNTVRFYRTVRLSGLSTENLVINGLTYINSAGTFINSSDEDIYMRGNLNYYGSFDLRGSNSTVYFDGGVQSIHKYSTNDGVFDNVYFTSSTGTTISNTGINAEGNITIGQGYFSPGSDTVYVGGNWTNYVGTGGFIEGTSRVVFNGGNYHQYCSNETFNILEVNKPLGGAFRMSGTNVVCSSYDWTAGAVDVLTGSFTANDLYDNGIVGAYYTNPGGIINLTSDGYIDLSGSLTLSGGGEIHVYGGTFDSYWPYAANSSITMSGGIIDIHDRGINISNTTSYTLTTNITGGVIRTSRSLSGNRTGFNPTAGTFELYGPTDWSLYQTNGCTFHDVVINKSSKGASNYIPKSVPSNDRPPDPPSNGSKANTITLGSDIVITGDLGIDAGSLTLNGHELTVENSCYVDGILNMTNAADILNVGATYYHGLYFYSGSTGNLTQGIANIYGWFQTDAGCSVNPSLTHTVIFKGVNGGGPNNHEPTATLGNVEIFKDAGHRTFCHALATQPIVVDGNFTVYPNNEFEIQDKTLIVHGLFTDNSTSIVYLYNAKKEGSTDESKGKIVVQDQIGSKSPNIVEVPIDAKGAKGGYLEIDTDFTLNGLLDVGDGEVYVHGHYTQPSTGSLSITSGSFICDEPTTSYCSVYGNFSLTSGLFEISNNHLRLNAVCSVTGGIIRSGGTFWASPDGTFQPTEGVVELIGTGSSGQYISMHENNYFHDLTINRTNMISIYNDTDLEIKNNFTILGGGLNSNAKDITIGGTWDNTVGTNAFTESTGKVVFNKASGGVQLINSDEDFNIIENNTSDQIRISSSQDTVTCNSYNWISGGVGVTFGTFIAQDLAQGGIYGKWYALIGSKIYLNQNPGQYVDMYSDRIYISDGLLKITGGDDESYWCSGSTALDLDIIEGGVLDFDGPGITIFDTQPLDDNIDNGTLRTSGWLTCNRSDFNPINSLTEFYGGTDSYINITAGSTLHDVLINKSGGLKTSYTFKDRDGKVQTGSKSNAAYLSINDLDVMGNLDIDAGTFGLSGETLNCYGNININDGGILNVSDNSILALDYLSYLHANSGGTLNLLGSPGNEARITHVSSSLYSLWIENGGTISAEHSLFEYMAYVYLRPGSTVDPVHSFHNCTFQNGSAGYPLMVFYNTQDIQINNAIFPTNTWSGPNNVRNVSEGEVTFYNASGDFAGSEYEHDDYNTIHWTTTSYDVDLEVFLEGPFDYGSFKMDLDLFDMGLIPTSQPFDLNPLADWYYTGPESVASIPDFVVDWVLVELRDAPNVADASPGRVVARQAGFVTNTGEVVGLDGLNPMDFDAAIFNNLYVTVWQRNHLGVISANPLLNVGGTYSYSFHTSSGQAYGGTSAQVQLSPGIWGLLSGDGNGNGSIGQPDKVNVWTIQAGQTDYLGGDFNLDGQVNNQDKNDFWVPNFSSDSYIPE